MGSIRVHSTTTNLLVLLGTTLVATFGCSDPESSSRQGSTGGNGTGGYGTGGYGTGGYGAGGTATNTATGGTSTGGVASGGMAAGGAATGGTTTNTATGGISSGSASTGGTSPAGGQPSVGTCAPGLATGDTCDPTFDFDLCELSGQDCTCEASRVWTCSPHSEGTGGGGAGGTTPETGGGGAGGTSSETGGGGAGGTSSETGGSGEGGTPSETGGSSEAYAYGATVENTGTDCDVSELPDPGQLPQISKFPDPFVKLDGNRITKTSEWRCRRQEIRKQAEQYIYGIKPTAAEVTGSVAEDRISVQVQDEGTQIEFSAEIDLPSGGQGPFPAIINVGGKGGFGGISLGESRILEQGVAVIYYDHYDLGMEGTPEASRGQPNPGKFYDIYGGNHSAGLLMAWAWGASRIIDVLQESGGDIIDYRKLGVTGCSRNGKGAFAIGVFDERIALTIPHETSTAGVPAYRIVDILGQERTDHNYYGLNWLSNNFEPFVFTGSSNAVKLPIDTHSLIGMIAPRGLLVLENPHQAQMGAPAGHAATIAGAEVYEALGVGGNISYHSNVSDTPHCSYKDEYTELLIHNIDKFLKHETEGPGEINPHSSAMEDLSDWRDWDTPSLEDDLTE